jgi:hypothetical protein
MRRRLTALAIAASIAGAVTTAGPVAAPLGTSAAFAKSCGGGYTHAVVNGSHKCLRRGQFCAHAADRQYHRYGFHCHSQDNRGNYHLT